jgi:hypothetical protein
VDNVGKGVAKNMTITSSQPVVTDNAKDLLINFQIIGAFVNLQPVSPSLTIDFGDIAPGDTSVGTFLMESSLAGTFTSFSATYQHIDDLGGLSSLIDSLDTHALNHVVRIVDPSDDGKPDFLTEETANANDLPDTVWDSNGAVEDPVTPITDAVTDGLVSNDNLTVHVSFPDTPTGFLYVQMNDPGQGNYALVSVVRSDGKQILVGPNAWTTKREVHPLSGGANLETRFYIFDYDGAGDTYTVTYAPIAPVLASLSPSTVPAGSPSFTLTVDGTGFVNGATVSFNGTAVPTIFVSPTELEGIIPASDVTTQGAVSVGVLNPNEQGTPAAPLTFTVGPAPPRPLVSITSPTDGSTTQPPASVTLKATASENGGTIAQVDYYANGVWVGSSTAAPYTVTLATPAVGLYSYTATATDTSGVSGTSPAVTLTVLAGGSAASPVIKSLSPSSAPQDSAAFTLGLTGTGFNEESQVAWNGQVLPTTFLSTTTLTADVAESLLQQAGTVQVTVTNPSLTNEVSGAYLFNVTPVTVTAASVTITSPSSGASIAVNQPESIKATATPSTGATIVAVDFYAGNTLIGSVQTAPYTIKWTPAAPGTFTLTAVVSDSNFLTATSKGVSITVATSNPAPTLSSLSVTSATAGSAGIPLGVTGSHFVSGSKVKWNGTALSTTFISSTKLLAALTASQLAVPGSFPVTVVNPAPGGGTSSAITFTIGVPSLVVKSTTFKVSGSNVIATLVIANTGTASAAGVSITGASLLTAKGTNAGTSLPISVGTIAVGATQTVIVTFPGAAPASASVALAKLSGTYLPSGTFSLTGVAVAP